MTVVGISLFSFIFRESILWEPASTSLVKKVYNAVPHLTASGRGFWTRFVSPPDWDGTFRGLVSSTPQPGWWCGGYTHEPNNKVGNEWCVIWRSGDKCFADYPCFKADPHSAICKRDNRFDIARKHLETFDSTNLCPDRIYSCDIPDKA